MWIVWLVVVGVPFSMLVVIFNTSPSTTLLGSFMVAVVLSKTPSEFASAPFKIPLKSASSLNITVMSS